MSGSLAQIDLIVVACYAIMLLAIAFWMTKKEAANNVDTKDYFLAGRSLPWWAIGASLIAANISAEQIIGMSGSGYALGLGIATYEWMAAATLIIVGKYLLPIFLKNKIYTIPQYLQQRFDSRVKTVLAIFWLGVFVFVNLTSVLWLGGLAIESVAGVNWLYGMIFLAMFSVLYASYGGLKVVAYTDIIQVVLLVFGGLVLSYLALQAISDQGGVFAGFAILTQEVPGHFDMILSQDNPFYKDLPGISVLIGGMWVINIGYWGFNQYIIQRALAAESLKEAQKGIMFAAFLKLLMPLIVVLPGIAALLLFPNLEKNDMAYPAMMTLMPVGLKGLIFAALIAAIISSLASMTNSISTIFTMDLYRPLKQGKDENHYVNVGRLVGVISLIIAIIAAKPLIGSFDQAFQYIQDFSAMFSPGIVVIFLMGMFYKRMTSAGALTAALSSFTISLFFFFVLPDVPFIDRVGIVFLACIILSYIVSISGNKVVANDTVDISEVNFKTSSSFNIFALLLVIILAALYLTWW
ncbi:sodium:solute symporter family transporter [Glaciecola petra]|uniref:Sodium/solute symporter n=1 Tax=Glaciecola petra TaxID=3075602 RepID=A0ABU2ZTU7_9ALTE|nr:sodium/solute symporter [Aestuariibacter sp. P117]MDT0596070.1 sodium/solute symporter [Aestuariibacter sp. P117]